MNQQNSTPRRRGSAPEATPTPEYSAEQDYSHFYTRSSAYYDKGETEFAPPVNLDELMGSNKEEAPQEFTPANIYASSRKAVKVPSEEKGYQAEAVPSQPRKKNMLWLLIPIGLILIGGLIWFFFLRGEPDSATPSPVSMPETEETASPASAYTAFEEPTVSTSTRDAIQKIAPNVQFVSTVLSDENVLAASASSNELYDFYLFSADKGRLIAYYEDLKIGDALFLQDGSLYVKQSPYVLNADGSAPVSAQRLESLFGKDAILHPFYRDWAAVETKDREWGFVNKEGNAFSNIEYIRLFPFSGDYTLAWLDTGNAVSENPYALYMLGRDGSSSRWPAYDNPDQIITCIDDIAVTADGDVYLLPNTETPAFHSQSVILYPEFKAMVLQDEAAGKKTLYIENKAAGSGQYDSVLPMTSNIAWKTAAYQDERLSVYVMTMDPYLFRLPENYTFILKNGAEEECLFLTRFSHTPLLLSGELPYPMEVIQ